MKTQKLILGGLFVLLFSVSFCGCINQKKVTQWLDEHPTEAAGYCADRFPPDTTAQVSYDSVDTKSYYQAYEQLNSYADSLFDQLQQERNQFVPAPGQPCPPAVNIDSLRRVVDGEIRRRLAPCKDSIKYIKYTVVDKAREKQLQGKLDEKDDVISARDETISENAAKIKSQSKWFWLFWGMVGLNILYVFLKLKLKLPF
jgi:hypothetical protein